MTREWRGTISWRFEPHPYKVTVPLMAVAQPQSVVALSWNPEQKMGRYAQRPAAPLCGTEPTLQ